MLGWIQSIFDVIRNIGALIFYFLDNVALVGQNVGQLVDGILDFTTIIFSELYSPLYTVSVIFFTLAFIRLVVSFWGKGGSS